MKNVINVRFLSLSLKVAAVAVLVAAAWIEPTSAQISRVGSSLTLGGGPTTRGTDVGFDPVNNVYISVGSTNSGSIRVIFTNTEAGVLQNYLILVGNDPPYGQFPRVKYAAQANNGAGGQGAFLVTYHSYGRVYAQLVSYAGGVVTQPVAINDTNSWEEAGASIAYSPVSQQFLVAWQTAAFGCRARFINTAGAPTGSVMIFANDGTGRDPSVAWNSTTNEFGFGYSGFSQSGAFVRFRTVTQAGVLGAASTFGYSASTFNTDTAVNPSTGNYVFVWAQPAGTGSSFAQLNSTGGLISSGPISTVIGGTDSLSVDFSPLSGTFLTVGQHSQAVEVYGRELDGTGAPLGSVLALSNGGVNGSFYPRVTSRLSTVANWLFSYSRNFNEVAGQVVATASSNPTPTPTPGVVTAPPASPPLGSGPTPPTNATPPSCTPSTEWMCMKRSRDAASHRGAGAAPRPVFNLYDREAWAGLGLCEWRLAAAPYARTWTWGCPSRQLTALPR